MARKHVRVSAAAIVGSVTGAESIEAMLKRIGDKHNLDKAVILPSLKKTAPIVVRALSDAAPRSVGWEAKYRRAHGKPPLFMTIGVNVNPNSHSSASIRIGAKYPDGAEAHLVNDGTKDRWSFQKDKKGRKVYVTHGLRYQYQRDPRKFRGRVTADHWMEKGWDACKSATEAALEKNVKEELKRHIEKQTQGND